MLGQLDAAIITVSIHNRDTGKGKGQDATDFPPALSFFSSRHNTAVVTLPVPSLQWTRSGGFHA
jgi:hypothetical protein